MLNKIFDFIFSKKNYGARTVITVLGLKLKLYDIKRELSGESFNLNKNTIQVLYSQLQSAPDDNLFCLRTNSLIFILHKNCLKLDYKFLQDYIIQQGLSRNILEFIKLDKDSVLYKEHIGRVKNGEFLWKYVERYYYISHSFISEDKSDGGIYINSSYVKEKDMVKSEYKIQHVPQISKRKYIKGITVSDYIKYKSKVEKFLIIDKLLNYIFSTYRDKENPNKVSGDLFDCHLNNFLIAEDGLFHFVDFDLKCTKSLDRGYCIYFMLYKYDIGLYEKFLKRYKLPDKHKYYENHFSIYKQPAKQNGKSIITYEHKKLQRKYFTDEGILPQYSIKYKRVKL